MIHQYINEIKQKLIWNSEKMVEAAPSLNQWVFYLLHLYLLEFFFFHLPCLFYQFLEIFSANLWDFLIFTFKNTNKTYAYPEILLYERCLKLVLCFIHAGSLFNILQIIKVTEMLDGIKKLINSKSGVHKQQISYLWFIRSRTSECICHIL